MPKKCEIEDCNNIAHYGSIDDFKIKYCRDHKNIEDNLIDIRFKNNYCKSCYIVQGSYGYENDKNNLFCKNCKLVDMIDIKHHKCFFEDCNKQPNYNFKEETNGIYCKTHKEINMVNVKSKRCLFKNCNKIPSYNFEGETNGIYCGTHKEINMVDVIHHRCLFKNCNKIPNYNFEGETNAIYCNTHKEINMVNIISKQCLFNNCNKIPTFNFEGKINAIYCKTHKEINMIDVIHHRCLFKNCNKIPNYNFEGETNAIYCNTHKKNNMIDVKSKRCITPLCDKQQQIDQYCYRCFYALNPNDNRCKKIKLRENEVKKYIQETFNDLSFIFDKPIKGDGLCFNKRPDALLNLNNHSIIVEVDENQHKWYDIKCDETRNHMIQEALNRPIIIIRFNPDDYIDENNKKILSPFKIDKKLGLTTIPKNNENEWNNRLTLLKETILENIEYKYDEPLIKT
jgi:hypothetical protein